MTTRTQNDTVRSPLLKHAETYIASSTSSSPIPLNSEKTEIITNLFLGNYGAFQEIYQSNPMKFTHVINISSQNDTDTNDSSVNVALPQNIKVLKINIPDLSNVNLSLFQQTSVIETGPTTQNDWFLKTNRFIDEALSANKKVLVQSSKGSSRSVTIIMAYLIRRKNYSYKRALDCIKAKKASIQPNMGFVYLLTNYAQILSLVKSVSSSAIQAPSPTNKGNHEVIPKKTFKKIPYVPFNPKQSATLKTFTCKCTIL